MAATKRRPTAKKTNMKSSKTTKSNKRVVVSKSSKSSLRNLSLRTKILAVLVFGAIGSYLLYTSFAETQAQYIVGMGSAGAIIESKDASGNITVAGGNALSFQVDSNNVLQCTNVNGNKVTTAQLTADQSNALANQVIAAGIQSQSDTIVTRGQGVLNATWVTVNANGVNKTVNIVGTVESNAFGRAVSAIARDACKQATKAVTAQASPSGQKKLSLAAAQALQQKIDNMLNAKVYADNTFGPRMETGQYVGVNFWRDTNGVTANLNPTGCLNNSARRHALQMAAYNEMSHQLPGEPQIGQRVTNNCGDSWTWAAENVAWSSDMSLNGVANLIDVMAEEKAPNDGHRQNDLSTHLTNIGAAAYLDYTHGKVWIVDDFAAGLSYAANHDGYAPLVDWNLNGIATVSAYPANDGNQSLNVSAGQTVYYHYTIADNGPSRANFTQYRTWNHYGPNGALLTSTDEHAESSDNIGWGFHGDNNPARCDNTTGWCFYGFSGRYYPDFTADSGGVTIPSTAKSGEKFCRFIHYTNASGPNTGAQNSNQACAVVK